MTLIARSVAAAFLCLALLPIVQAAETFKITQAAPNLSYIDLGTSGTSQGDLLAFEASFKTEDGKPGVMSGLITTVSLPTGTSDPFFDRIGTIVLDFGGIDSLVLTGRSMYGSGSGEMNPNAEQVRAITGGTGRFIGARGQVTTTRRDAGHYEHVIQIVD